MHSVHPVCRMAGVWRQRFLAVVKAGSHQHHPLHHELPLPCLIPSPRPRLRHISRLSRRACRWLYTSQTLCGEQPSAAGVIDSQGATSKDTDAQNLNNNSTVEYGSGECSSSTLQESAINSVAASPLCHTNEKTGDCAHPNMKPVMHLKCEDASMSQTVDPQLHKQHNVSMQLSKKRGFSPSGRLRSMLAADFWEVQTENAKDSVSVLEGTTLTAQAGSGFGSQHSTQNSTTLDLDHLSNTPLQYDELVVFTTKKVTVTHDKLSYLKSGTSLTLASLAVGRKEFDVIKKGEKYSTIVSRPTLEQYMKHVWQDTVCPDSKVWYTIL